MGCTDHSNHVLLKLWPRHQDLGEQWTGGHDAHSYVDDELEAIEHIHWLDYDEADVDSDVVGKDFAHNEVGENRSYQPASTSLLP